MPGGDACLLDSIILLRINKSDDPQHAAISHAIRALVGQGHGSATPRRRLGSAARKYLPVFARLLPLPFGNAPIDTKSLEIFGTSTYLSYR